MGKTKKGKREKSQRRKREKGIHEDFAVTVMTFLIYTKAKLLED
jgi:hypothetical protein